MKGSAGELKGGGRGLVGREVASAEGGEFEGLFDDDPVLTSEWYLVVGS